MCASGRAFLQISLQRKMCSYRDLEVNEMDSVKNAEKIKCGDKQRDRKIIPDLYLLIKNK